MWTAESAEEEVGTVMMCYDFSWERTLTEEQISARTKKRQVCPCKVTTAGCSLLFQYQISFNKLQLTALPVRRK